MREVVLLHELVHFLRERPFLMVFLLVIYVRPDALQHRFTDRNCIVFACPLKFDRRNFLIVNPMCRLAFKKLQCFGNCHVGIEAEQTMKMFRVAVKTIYVDPFLLRVLMNVRDGSRTNLFPEIRFSVFCSPYCMYPYPY